MRGAVSTGLNCTEKSEGELNIYIYIYIYMNITFSYIIMCIYIYIYRERERLKERRGQTTKGNDKKVSPKLDLIDVVIVSSRKSSVLINCHVYVMFENIKRVCLIGMVTVCPRMSSILSTVVLNLCLKNSSMCLNCHARVLFEIMCISCCCVVCSYNLDPKLAMRASNSTSGFETWLRNVVCVIEFETWLGNLKRRAESKTLTQRV